MPNDTLYDDSDYYGHADDDAHAARVAAGSGLTAARDDDMHEASLMSLLAQIASLGQYVDVHVAAPCAGLRAFLMANGKRDEYVCDGQTIRQVSYRLSESAHGSRITIFLD